MDFSPPGARHTPARVGPGWPGCPPAGRLGEPDPPGSGRPEIPGLQPAPGRALHPQPTRRGGSGSARARRGISRAPVRAAGRNPGRPGTGPAFSSREESGPTRTRPPSSGRRPAGSRRPATALRGNRGAKKVGNGAIDGALIRDYSLKSTPL